MDGHFPIPHASGGRTERMAVVGFVAGVDAEGSDGDPPGPSDDLKLRTLFGYDRTVTFSTTPDGFIQGTVFKKGTMATVVNVFGDSVSEVLGRMYKEYLAHARNRA